MKFGEAYPLMTYFDYDFSIIQNQNLLSENISHNTYTSVL